MPNGLKEKRDRVMRANALMRNNRVTIDQSEYLKQAALRKELPEYIKDRIQSCVAEILEKYPDTKEIYLIGSYTNGTYIDENTTEEFKSLKEIILGKVKLSDFDFEIVPNKYDSFISKDEYQIHLWKDRQNNKIKIY